MPDLHNLVVRLLRRIETDGLAVDLVADWSDLQDLDRLAREYTDPAPADALTLMAMPVYAGETPLYRLPFGAIEWYTHCACEWFADEPRMQNLALAYAMAHARKHEEVLRLSTQIRARGAIWLWATRLRCSAAELMAAVDRLLPKSGAEPSVDKAEHVPLVKSGAVVAALMKASGQTEEYWLWDVSADEALCLLRERAALLEREGGQDAALDGRTVEAYLRFLGRQKRFIEKVKGRHRGLLDGKPGGAPSAGDAECPAPPQSTGRSGSTLTVPEATIP